MNKNKQIIFRPVELIPSQDANWFNATAKEIGAEVRAIRLNEYELELNGDGLECESHPDGDGLIWTDKKTGVQVIVDWGDRPNLGKDAEFPRYVVYLH